MHKERVSFFIHQVVNRDWLTSVAKPAAQLMLSLIVRHLYQDIFTTRRLRLDTCHQPMFAVVSRTPGWLLH